MLAPCLALYEQISLPVAGLCTVTFLPVTFFPTCPLFLFFLSLYSYCYPNELLPFFLFLFFPLVHCHFLSCYFFSYLKLLLSFLFLFFPLVHCYFLSCYFFSGLAISSTPPEKSGNFRGNNRPGRNMFLPPILEEMEETKNWCHISILAHVASWLYTTKENFKWELA